MGMAVMMTEEYTCTTAMVGYLHIIIIIFEGEKEFSSIVKP